MFIIIGKNIFLAVSKKSIDKLLGRTIIYLSDTFDKIFSYRSVGGD
jgi:hypothetical protein